MQTKKIPDTNGLVKKTDCNANITEIEGLVTNITNLATTTALTVVENKIPSVSKLVEKSDYNTRINEIEMKITDLNYDKYITTPEFNKLTAENSTPRLKLANLARKNNIANFVNKTDVNNKLSTFNKRINSYKTKHLLVENELKNYRHFIQDFLLVKVTLIMMKDKFT